MPKTLDIQGFSGLREEVVRLEGRPSRSPVQQALIGWTLQSKRLKSPGKPWFNSDKELIYLSTVS